MQKYQDVATIIGPPGLIPIVGANVAVSQFGVVATTTIYSDNGSTVAANPLRTNRNGEYYFYAPDGHYSLDISGTGLQTTNKDDILLFDGSSYFVNVKASPFNAKGDYNPSSRTGTDDTAAIQSAITFCLTHTIQDSSGFRALSLYIPHGCYLITTSLNATSSTNAFIAFKMFGDGFFRSQIWGGLSAAFPVLDMMGNGFGEVSDLSVHSIGGSESCGLLIGSAASTGSSSGQQMRIVNFGSNIGLVNLGTDLPYLIEPNITSGRGPAFTTGPSNPNGIVSAYQTQAVSGYTQGTVIGGQLTTNDPSQPAVWMTGGDALNIHDTYIAVTGVPGSRKGIIHLGYDKANQSHALRFFGARTENQSSQTGLPVISASARTVANTSANGILHGTFFSDSAGVLIDYPAAKGALSGYDINTDAAGSGLAAIASTGTKIIDTKISCQLILLGTLDSGSSSIEVRGIQNTQIAGALAANSTVKNLKLVDNNGIEYIPLATKKYQPLASTTSLFDLTQFLASAGNSTAYTGGSGLQTVSSYVVPANLIVSSVSGSPPRHCLIRVVGVVGAAAAGTGEVKVVGSDGVHSVTLIDATGISAFSSGNAGIVLELDIWDAGSSGVAAIGVTKLTIGSQVFSNRANIGSQSILLTADITINIQVNNSGNDPYNFQFANGLV